jgi:hypothetical protein
MVVDYPILRRRAPRGVEVDVPDLPPRNSLPRSNRWRWKVSRIYCAVSLIVAVSAIVLGPVAKETQPTTPVPPTPKKNARRFIQYFFPKRHELQPVKSPGKKLPRWLRWILPKEEEPIAIEIPQPKAWMVDPAFFQPQPLTALLDKILTSTPRLLLSITYLVHTAVANLFLDLPSLSRESWGGRERLGGFLVFKLLLVSAVLAPDTLDLLILLSWYTLLSFLRSLAGLAAATTSHTSQSGQRPRSGVFNLLVLILISDIVSASVCVALFHGAGWSMVLLLTCDCALLAFDAISHILRHCIQTLDLSHSEQISELEATQVAMHSRARDHQQRSEIKDENVMDSGKDNQEDGAYLSKKNKNHIFGEAELLEASRRLDQRMEMMESLHNRRLNILENTVFGLQLIAYFLTVVHFLHIWSLHGLQFTLIDGVLALHLHSAISGACKKISERRNLNRIARDLDITFEDATEIELSKSVDNICCICLGTMTTGSVKKVGCGHLYHTHCLREIVERARCMEAAKCPLCRSSVLTGDPPDSPSSDDNGNGINNPIGGGEHSLFRFSTEGILPAWLPMPSVSFEVVRRPPMENVIIAPDSLNNSANQGAATVRNAEPMNPVAALPPTATVIGDSPSFLRRLLRIAGLFPMSAAEEASALEQLVDMFPQYDRADLLRELRLRGVAEGVVESILMGVFQGAQRGPVEGERNSNNDNIETNS